MAFGTVGPKTASMPSLCTPIVNQEGHVTAAWHRLFTALASGPQAAQTHDADGSPYTYSASANGTLIVSGGTVTDIKITRASFTADLGAVSGPIPLRVGDVAVIAYSVKPNITFLPG